MRNSRCKRNQRQAGGGLGGVVEFKADSLGPIVNNDLAWAKGGSCLDAPRPGFLSGGVHPQGLPGMSGGRRRKGSRKGRKNRKASRKNRRNNIFQSGGRYGFDASAASTIGGTPSTSGYAPVSSIPCEASRQSIPDSGASNTLNSRSSYLWSGPQLEKGMTGGGIGPANFQGTPLTQIGEMKSMTGGAQLITPSPTTWNTHGLGPDGSNIGLQVDKASYTQNAVAPIQSAAGTNIMINTPSSKIYESAACFKTGGGTRRRRAKTGGRKNKKNSRKNKKSRKSRKN